MSHRLFTVVAALCLLAMASAPALAQGGRTASSLSGIVTDVSGAVIPGATITVKNNATNVRFETFSNEHGAFSVPALDAGTYTVTV